LKDVAMMTTMVQTVKTGWLLGLAVLLVALGGGCGTPSGARNFVPPTGAPPTGAPPFGADVVRVGDKIEITFSDIPEMFPTMIQRVREDGSIRLPYGVQIEAADKKVADLQDVIEQAYVPKYFKRLTVAVKLEERVFYVGGQVRSPNRYVFLGEMTVLGAIKVAGDFTEFAKRTAVKITRADGTEIKVDCKKALKNSKYDLPIYPGDKLDVPRKLL
jgi:protein involved in polysaccharide export with SLBB domain